MRYTIQIETESRLKPEQLRSLVRSRLDGLADLPVNYVAVKTPQSRPIQLHQFVNSNHGLPPGGVY